MPAVVTAAQDSGHRKADLKWFGRLYTLSYTHRLVPLLLRPQVLPPYLLRLVRVRMPELRRHSEQNLSS